MRADLLELLEKEPPGVPRFYELSGWITAMLICPTTLAPSAVFAVAWAPDGRTGHDEHAARRFANLLTAYWNLVNNLVRNAIAPDAHPDEQILDLWEDDFEGDNGGILMAAATFAWATGFKRATERWPDAWGDALKRPDLAPHWEVVDWWVGFDSKENRDLVIAHAEAEKPRTLNASVVALARAMRPKLPPGK